MKRTIFPAVLLLFSVAALAQRGANALGDGPWTYTTSERATRIRVSVVTKGLSNPWSMAWLPNGDMLITERAGRLRILRNGVLDPTPIPGVPQAQVGGTSGLLDIALHPKFATNGLVYLAYNVSKPAPVAAAPADPAPVAGRGGRGGGPANVYSTALARGRFDGKALVDVKQIFVAEPWMALSGGDASRIVFGPDGTLFMSSSHHRDLIAPQDPMNDAGKILRLNDDGSIPKDNPFVGKPGYRPEIYSIGHRTVLGLTFHPTTGALWETENGPQGGDEVNVIQAGKNYGWPLVTYGHDYDGTALNERPIPPGTVLPMLFWVPSITTSGLTFYNGDKFPAWKGNLFVGSMTVGRIGGTGHVQRIVFNERGEQRRESLLTDLRQRVRDVREGPDGLLYLLTDEIAGALLKIEPAP
ncbi:MAG TPA: PQQ-dependent sugar dehydrogenase [Terriglobia bacterium]|nr:PQQ-dependent sugar dehydrogenase [Terriglobia bacterium]